MLDDNLVLMLLNCDSDSFPFYIHKKMIDEGCSRRFLAFFVGNMFFVELVIGLVSLGWNISLIFVQDRISKGIMCLSSCVKSTEKSILHGTPELITRFI